LTGKPPSVLPSSNKLPLFGKQLSSGSLVYSNISTVRHLHNTRHILLTALMQYTARDTDCINTQYVRNVHQQTVVVPNRGLHGLGSPWAGPGFKRNYTQMHTYNK